MVFTNLNMISDNLDFSFDNLNIIFVNLNLIYDNMDLSFDNLNMVFIKSNAITFEMFSQILHLNDVDAIRLPRHHILITPILKVNK